MYLVALFYAEINRDLLDVLFHKAGSSGKSSRSRSTAMAEVEVAEGEDSPVV